MHHSTYIDKKLNCVGILTTIKNKFNHSTLLLEIHSNHFSRKKLRLYRRHTIF